jgi:AcrR family transcriptional regulator
MKIIENDKDDELSVRLIAKTAGITLSSFYQYFPNIDSVVASALLKNDQDDERSANIKKQLTQQHLTRFQVIELLIDAICDGHIRFLKKYGHIYRRYHRFIYDRICIGFNEEGLAQLVDWGVWFRHILETYCRPTQHPPTEMALFIITNAVVELLAKAVDERPHYLDDGEFRKALVDILVSQLR